MDMNRFAPERPGGGGLGFAIALPTTVEVRCTDGPDEIRYAREPIVRHFLAVFRAATGYAGGFSVTADHHAHPHVGLGSTSTVLIALAHALNAAVGSPLSDDQLRLLLGHNYVEETAGGEIAFGFETGVGPSVSTYGGMAVMGDELTLVYQHPFAEGCTVFVIIPSSDISSAGAKEFDLLMNRARTLDYQDRELKAYLLLMDLIPALEAGDVRKVGDVVWEIEFRGSKRAEIEHHTFAIYAYMNRLREARVRVRGHVLGRPLDRGHHAAVAAGARGGGRSRSGSRSRSRPTVDNTGILVDYLDD